MAVATGKKEYRSEFPAFEQSAVLSLTALVIVIVSTTNVTVVANKLVISETRLALCNFTAAYIYNQMLSLVMSPCKLFCREGQAR